MHIHQVSAALDIKLKQLDQQLQQLDHQLAQNSTSNLGQLEQDKAALIKIRDKLIKSKELAWQAHRLQYENNEQQRARQRLMGLALCGFSLIGGVLLVAFALTQ